MWLDQQAEVYRLRPPSLHLCGPADRDHHNASGPSRLLTPRTANAANQAVELAGPPAASSATPTAHAPAAERPKPTVECSAMVAPRCAGTALRLMPDVKAPESAGIVTP